MEKSKKKTKKIALIAGIIVLIAGLLVSIGFNIYFGIYYIKQNTYLQSTEQIYIMEAGVLCNNLDFHDGTDYKLQYDFSHEDYEILKSKYQIENTAKGGTEFERALLLMNEYAPRLTHKSDYDNHREQSATDLLEYSLDNRSHGINCRAKAQIFNEMCLALGIYSRKVWIMPYSKYDSDCHVVNEVWDTSLDKWVMLDITNNEYWVDENNMPLSILEIRSKVALREFCTPVKADDKTNNLQGLKDKNIGDFLYIVKNMAFMEYCTEYTVGESADFYLLTPQNVPQNAPTEKALIINKDAVESAPMPNN